MVPDIFVSRRSLSLASLLEGYETGLPMSLGSYPARLVRVCSEGAAAFDQASLDCGTTDAASVVRGLLHCRASLVSPLIRLELQATR